MACPALPLCGLATTEAERALPDINVRIRASMAKAGLPADATLIVRMTGCPNGCARPYIAELGFVGDGPNSYQVRLARRAAPRAVCVRAAGAHAALAAATCHAACQRCSSASTASCAHSCARAACADMDWR